MAIILATGGAGRAFAVTSNSWECSGDGYALAWRAGAELIDMEFVQFHPTGMVHPPGVRGLLVTEAVRGEGGILRNADGERFMWRYLPEDRRDEYAATDEEARAWVDALTEGRVTDLRRPPELSTRDNVARAIYTEVKEGRGSPHGGVFLDISYLPAERVRRKLPSMYDQFKELADVDITAGPMEVGPTAHYMMGGIRVDADTGATTMPGLYAAGEVAAGLHGSNRLGGNSLTDLLVFGRRAGEAAVEATPTGSTASAPALRLRGRVPGGHGGTLRAQRRGSQSPPRRAQGDDVEPGRHLPHGGGPGRGHHAYRRLQGALAESGGDRTASLQPGLGPRLRAAQHAGCLGGHRPLGPGAHGEPRRPQSSRPRRHATGVGRRQRRGAAQGGPWSCDRRPPATSRPSCAST